MASKNNNPTPGSSARSLDEKNRVTVPSAWRAAFPEDAEFLVIPQTGGYLAVLAPEPARQLNEKLGRIRMGDTEGQFQKARFLAKTLSFRFDTQGRMPSLSEPLLRHAGLKGERDDLMLVNMTTQFNLYSHAKWEEINRPSSDEDLQSLFDKIDPPDGENPEN